MIIRIETEYCIVIQDHAYCVVKIKRAMGREVNLEIIEEFQNYGEAQAACNRLNEEAKK